MKYYRTPPGTSYPLYRSLLNQSHVLIAGTTGSGKSVVVRGLIQELSLSGPAEKGLILIDPKRVELSPFRKLPHVIAYGSEPEDMVNCLQRAMTLTESRYRTMQKNGLYSWTGGSVYVVIDELADLMTTQKKVVQPLIQRLCQIARAASVHVIACTQCPISVVIPTPIKVNFDARLALRTRCRQDSRNILDAGGAELLPRYGEGLYLIPEGMQHVQIPFTSPEDVAERVKYWTRQRPRPAWFYKLTGS